MKKLIVMLAAAAMIAGLSGCACCSPKADTAAKPACCGDTCACSSACDASCACCAPKADKAECTKAKKDKEPKKAAVKATKKASKKAAAETP